MSATRWKMKRRQRFTVLVACLACAGPPLLGAGVLGGRDAGLTLCRLAPETSSRESVAGERDVAANSGRGWRLVQLDVNVEVDPKRGVIETDGVVTLRLDGLEESYGPLLLLNTRHTAEKAAGITFRRVASSGATAQIDEELLAGVLTQAWVRFAQPKPRGATIEVAFASATQGAVRRMIAHPAAAMADWGAGWLPFTQPDGNVESLSITAGLLAVPGRTTLHLPAGWTGLVDGDLVERRADEEGTVEVWRTPEGIARGFVAGPYKVLETALAGRTIRVYVLDEAQRAASQRLAERMGRAIAAQEARLGPFPVSGPYSIVAFPHLPQQSFGAVSEQTHVIVQPPNLEYAFENIQLLAHEAAHAWWGNAIGTAGSGSKWCSESLAQLGSLIAIEALDGDQALRDFLDFAALGTDPYYSAAGYFTLLRQGQDQPIATMGGGPGTHALANSRGVWVFHMLRRKLGDELFFGVLREVIHDFTGGVLTADDLRRRFVEAAPEHDLEGFFSQWLDRDGAPVLDVDWHANADGTAVLVELTQLQPGGPFAFDLDLEIELTGGGSKLERVVVDGREHTFEIATAARPVGVRFDPRRAVLLWRPEYGPRPVDEIVAASMRAPQVIVEAVVGSYVFEDFDKAVEVFEREGVLYMQPAGSAPVRLLPDGGGRFRVDGPGGMLAEFDLSETPARSFVSIEGGGRERYVARRVAAGDSGDRR